MRHSFSSLSLCLLVLGACNARIEALSSEAPAPGSSRADPGVFPPANDASADGATTPRPGPLPYQAPAQAGPSLKCDWQGEVFTPLSAPCKNRCLAEYAAGKAPRVLADDGDLPYQFSIVLAASASHTYVVAYNFARGSGGTGNALIAFPVAGGAPTVLFDWDPTTGFAFALEGGDVLVAHSRPVSSTSFSTAVYRVPTHALAPLGASNQLTTLSTSVPVTRVWGATGDVYVRSGWPHSATVEVDRLVAGNYTVQRALAQPNVIAAEADAGFLYWIESDSKTQSVGSRVMRRALPNGAVERLLEVEAAGAIAFGGASESVLVMGAQRLYAMNLDGTNARELYRGQPFVQHDGTLKPGYLHVDMAKRAVYFGEICRPDADAPSYGVRVLALDNPVVSWLDNDPSFPWHAENFRFGLRGQGEEGALPNNAAGVYALPIQ